MKINDPPTIENRTFSIMPCNRPFLRTGFRKREKESEINKRRKDQLERRGKWVTNKKLFHE
jgi:hypothetical protein